METEQQRKDGALKEYMKIRDTAWEEYNKIIDPAWEEYFIKCEEINAEEEREESI